MKQIITIYPQSSREGFIAAIINGTTELCLTNIINITSPQLVEIFVAIPTFITTLDLSGNNLHKMNGQRLAQIFAAIPNSITTLNLSDNWLGLQSIQDLERAFAAIPSSVVSLNLSDNALNGRTVLINGLNVPQEAVAKALAKIPNSINTLNLSGNYLGFQSGDHLIQAFAAIPSSVTSLNLRFNQLAHKNSEELGRAFAAIPSSVISLDLGGNQLGNISGEQLGRAFRAIPSFVTSLDLTENNLGNYSAEKLAQVLASIPSSVTSLNLSRNELYSIERTRQPSVFHVDLAGKYILSGQELARAFRAIPFSVTSLDLAENNLGNKSLEELAEGLDVIPSYVHVSLRNNLLFQYKNPKQRDALLQILNQYRISCKLDLSFNGEADFQRALAPMICFSRKPIGSSTTGLPLTLVEQILSFLVPTKRFSSTQIQSKIQQQIGLLFSIIKDRPSDNQTLSVGIPLQR